MLIEKMVLKTEDGQTFRLLKLTSDGGILVPCNKYGLPFQQPIDILRHYKESVLPENEMMLLSEEDFPDWKKEVRDWRWSLIKEIVDEQYLVDARKRRILIKEAANKGQCSTKTINKYLWLYWVYQTPNALIPQDKGKRNTIQVSHQDEDSYDKVFRWALNRFYYTPQKQTLEMACLIYPILFSSAIRQALARTRAAQKKVVHPKDDTMEIIRLEKQAATEARAYLAVKQIPPMNTCAIVGNDGFGANRSVWSLCESGNDFEELICRIGYTLLGRYSTGGFISKLTVFAPTMAAYVLARYVWAGLPDYEAETDPVKKAFAAMAAQAKFSGLDVDVIPTECPTEHGQMMADLMARECMANLTSYHIVSEAEQAERIVASVTAQNKTHDKEEKQ